jgi:Uma2 family endonuclease
MSTQIEPVLTIKDLDALPDDGNRYEIIEGELFVSRASSLIHQTVSGNLFFKLKRYLSDKPIGRIWATPGVTLSEFDGVIPDIVFVSTDRCEAIASGERIIGAPDLVIEIVSPGAENERRDRVVKRHLYGKFGVKEYWVVYLDRRAIEIYCLSGRVLNLHAALNTGDYVESMVLPGFTCKVEDLFLG